MSNLSKVFFMDEILKQEKLLLRILHLLNKKFKNKIFLKGGMQLRLLNSPRYTQDIDFVFCPKISRKIIAKEIESALAKESDITIKNIRMNSRGIFLDTVSDGIIAKLEISVEKELNCPPEIQSTVALSQNVQMESELVSTLSKQEAFSHKIAAALERNVARDLYDISIFEPLTSFDEKTLKKRLEKLEVNRQKPAPYTFDEAAQKLKQKADKLTQENIDESLGTMLPQNARVGAVDRIKISICRLVQILEIGKKKS